MYDENSKPVLDEMGKQKKKIVNREFHSFRPAYVFDVQQTSGEPLPTLATMLEESVEGYEQLKEALILSDGTLWEGQIALYFRWTCLPDCAVPELDADYRRNNRRLS